MTAPSPDATTAAWEELHAAVSARSSRVAEALDTLWSTTSAALTTTAGRERFLADALHLVQAAYAENSAEALRAYSLAREAAGLGPLPATATAAVVAGEADPGAVLETINRSVTSATGDGAAARGRAALASASARAVALAADGASDTVRRQAARDPHAVGWARYDPATPCDRCTVVIARGIAYKSEATASFFRHDGCRCQARAVFTGEPVPAASLEAERLYRATADGAYVYPEDHRLAGEPLSLRSVLAYRREGRLDEFRRPTA